MTTTFRTPFTKPNWGRSTATITYRKTKQGEWVAYGPASAITEGATVTVTKKDGTTKTETIARVGRPFQADGRTMVYGYLRPSTRSNTGSHRHGDDRCMECGGRLSSLDRRASAMPGYHIDCA